jgi:hypothetical protein
VLDVMRRPPPGTGSRRIGTCVGGAPRLVVARTGLGGTRLVDLPIGEQLRRICGQARGSGDGKAGGQSWAGAAMPSSCSPWSNVAAVSRQSASRLHRSAGVSARSTGQAS